MGKSVLNLVSAYAPRTSWKTYAGEGEFITLLGKIVTEMDFGGILLICADLNRHLGAEVGGFSRVCMVGSGLAKGIWKVK